MIGRRTALVAALVGAATSVVLGAWYHSGITAADRDAAGQVEAVLRDEQLEAVALADELTAALEALRVRESARPYLHYQNLFHDPDGASSGPSVTPSPLATGSADPLIALHFQIDADGAVTSPSINDELPEARQAASPDRAALAAIAAARTGLLQVAARGAVQVEQPADALKLASIEAKPTKSKQRATSKKVAAALTPQVIELAPDAYAQNQSTNAIYAEQKGLPRNVDERPAPPTADAQRAAAAPIATPRRPTPQSVIVTVAPLVWTIDPINAAPTLVAVRQVVTPDGARTQGFTIDRAALEEWLTEREPQARLLTDVDVGASLGIAGAPWRIAVTFDDARAYARRTAGHFRDTFLVKFSAVALLVAACGLAVIVVAARGERLATQRVEFAAAAAHELRTPLAGIQLYGDMLADELGDPTRQRDYARRVAVEAARLGRVVGNVMGVSQLERGALAVRAEPLDVVPVVREAIERAEPGLVRAGATVELRGPAVAMARGDRDGLARILGNLLDNAEKYGRDADDRAITVTITASRDAVTIAVRDRGPGLPPRLRRGRFRAFARAAGPDGPAGLGLGLALSAALARAMGGALTPRAVDVGAELVVRLPAHGATGSSDPHTASV